MPVIKWKPETRKRISFFHKLCNKPSFSQSKSGFTLIEIVLSMFVILAIITILLTASATYNTSRRSNLQVTAGKIAAKQIETLRKAPYSSLSIGSGSFSDPDLSKLPNANARQTFSFYQFNQSIKQVEIMVGWSEGERLKSIKMDSLIYENGL